MSYYTDQLEKIELHNNSKDIIKLSLVDNCKGSGYLDVNENSIDDIIEFFIKIKNIVGKPNENEFNNQMKEIIRNSETFNRPTIIEKYGDYYFKYFRDINQPIYISTKHVICGDIVGTDSRGETKHLGIYLDAENKWNAIIASREDIRLLSDDDDSFRNVSIEACRNILLEGIEKIHYHDDDSEMVELKTMKQLNELVQNNIDERFFIFKK